MMTAVSAISSYQSKEKLHNLISEIIEKTTGDKDGQKINRTERGLTRFIARQWNLVVTTAIEKALGKIDLRSNSPVTEKDAEEIKAEVERVMAKVSGKVEKRVKRDIRRIYRENKVRFRNRFRIKEAKALYFDQRKVRDFVLKKAIRAGIQKQGEEELIEIVFTSTDQATVSNLSRLHLLAVSEHYSNNHKRLISQMIDDSVIRQGLSKKEAGQVLREGLTKRLGGFDRAVPAAIKQQGQRATAAYFEGLSATSVTRARNFGQINLMNEAGITQLVWDSIIDNRTSQICLDMNGRIFTIEQVNAQKNSILELESSEELKQNFGWKKSLSEFGIRAGERLSSTEVGNLLARSGVPIIPPAHFRCRSELNPA